MTHTIPDVIDHLVGISPGTPIDALRTRRPVTKENAEKSFRALFEPASTVDASLTERFAVAYFVAQLHEAEDIARFYGERLVSDGDGTAIFADLKAAAVAAAGKGPYGHYPAGPLSGEDQDGPTYLVSDDLKTALGPRLAAALEHAHLLVFHLRDASPQALEKLIGAGWSTTGIVTLSQLVSFLAFQIRVVAGLKVLAAA